MKKKRSNNKRSNQFGNKSMDTSDYIKNKKQNILIILNSMLHTIVYVLRTVNYERGSYVFFYARTSYTYFYHLHSTDVLYMHNFLTSP